MDDVIYILTSWPITVPLFTFICLLVCGNVAAYFIAKG